MGFLAPLILGLVAGSFAMWQLSHRQQPSKDVDHEVATANEAQAIVHKRHEPEQDEASTLAGPPADKLDAIRGIGPVYAQRLSSAGIRSFAQLAELAPEQVGEIVGQGKAENLVNARGWIDQARQLAKKSIT